MAGDVDVRRTTRAMRAMLWFGGFLVFLAGIQLYFLTGDTERYFAWTIESGATAAFLGAFYWTSVALATLSARRPVWADARVGLVGVQVFVWSMLLATLLHLDLLHFDSDDSFARGAAWLWLAVYAIEPPVLLAIYLRQLRAPGRDPERTAPATPLYRAAASAQAAVVLFFGVALMAVPETAGRWWPWPLTPLGARASAAWLLGLGLVLAWAVIEDDFVRLHQASVSYCVLGVLQLVTLWRYPDEVEWGAIRTWLYVAFLASVLALGGYGWLRARARRRAPSARTAVAT